MYFDNTYLLYTYYIQPYNTYSRKQNTFYICFYKNIEMTNDMRLVPEYCMFLSFQYMVRVKVGYSVQCPTYSISFLLF